MENDRTNHLASSKEDNYYRWNDHYNYASIMAFFIIVHKKFIYCPEDCYSLNYQPNKKLYEFFLIKEYIYQVEKVFIQNV